MAYDSIRRRKDRPEHSETIEFDANGAGEIGYAESLEVDEGSNGESESWRKEGKRYWNFSVGGDFDVATGFGGFGQSGNGENSVSSASSLLS